MSTKWEFLASTDAIGTNEIYIYPDKMWSTVINSRGSLICDLIKLNHPVLVGHIRITGEGCQSILLYTMKKIRIITAILVES